MRNITLSPYYQLGGVLFLAIVGAFISASLGFELTLVMVMVAPAMIFLILSFERPDYFIQAAVVMGFLIAMLGRYVPGGIPFGLSLDALLVLTILAMIFKRSISWNTLLIRNPVTLSLGGWFLFSIITLANPHGSSAEAWFYANRGLSIYPLLFAIGTLFVFDEKHLKYFLIIWAVMSVFGTLWGIKQLFLGVSQVEQQWLNAGAASTHILFGRLRVFSYFSDSAQFAANQSHTAVLFGIMGLFAKRIKYRWLYIAVALLTFYGVLISGTRGVLAVIAFGGLTYLVMIKNFKIIILGAMVAIGTFAFLKYTTIGQSNYQINRMRTALNADDPSFQVRQDRIRTLKGYLADKPLGGGIGSAGYWGKRFSPGSFLGEIGTDGHYTRIWMETGVIGLYLYITMLVALIYFLGKKLWNMEDSFQRQILVGFLSAFVGLCVASYTNGLMVQNPTGPLLFISLAAIQKFAKSASLNKTSC